jgi:hypothetical protein
VPTRGDRTWEIKGAKHIQVLGIKNKRKIKVIGQLPQMEHYLLPLQIVFQGTTNHSFPPMNEGKTFFFFGFHLTFSSNH